MKKISKVKKIICLFFRHSLSPELRLWKLCMPKIDVTITKLEKQCCRCKEWISLPEDVEETINSGTPCCNSFFENTNIPIPGDKDGYFSRCVNCKKQYPIIG